MLRRIIALVFGMLLLAPSLAAGQTTIRPASQGAVYLGVAPGMNLGGQGPPRELYMDMVQLGYLLPSGLDFSLALSGMNFFPDEGDYALSMGRFTVGYRPLMRDPLPMIQPYVLAGSGLGAEGRYNCEDEPGSSKDVQNRVCSRARWVGDAFVGLGVDLNTHLFWLGSQQVLLYGGVQARYEWIFGRYQMPVVTFPVGLRLQ